MAQPPGYTGYLKRYLTKIIADHKAGLSPSMIALRLTEVIDDYGWPHAASGPMIAYVLRRTGYLPDPRGDERRERRAAELLAKTKARFITPEYPAPDTSKVRYVIVGWPPAPPRKWRPLDMGGPRDQWIERDPIWSDY